MVLWSTPNLFQGFHSRLDSYLLVDCCLIKKDFSRDEYWRYLSVLLLKCSLQLSVVCVNPFSIRAVFQVNPIPKGTTKQLLQLRLCTLHIYHTVYD